MVRVQSQLGAVLADAALGPHHKGFAAAVAELVFALDASEMHATSFR